MGDLHDVGMKLLSKLIRSTRYHTAYATLPEVLREPDVILSLLADGYIEVGIVMEVDAEGAEEYADIPDERYLGKAIRTGQYDAWPYSHGPKPLAIKLTRRGLAALQVRGQDDSKQFAVSRAQDEEVPSAKVKLISGTVVLDKYQGVSRATLGRYIKNGTLKDYRRPGHPSNAAYQFDEDEIERIFRRKEKIGSRNRS